MKTLPADFPQSPAESAGLASCMAWIVQVLRWLMARVAAGDMGWIGEDQGRSEARGGAQGGTPPEPRHAAERELKRNDATQRDADSVRPALAQLGGKQREGRPSAQHAETPPSPQRSASRSAPPRRRSRSRTTHLSGQAPAPSPRMSRPGGRSAARHPRATTGPPRFSRA